MTSSVGSWFGFRLWWLLGAMAIALTLVLAFPGMMRRVSDSMLDRPVASLGWGLIVMFITPLVGGALLATIIGIPLGLLMLAIWLILLALTSIFAGVAAGVWVLERFGWTQGSLVWGAIAGALIAVILYSIPFVGVFIALVAAWWAFGGIALSARRLRA